mmetsp:Transcript_13696/g.21674  ORF Transcript_13696/g.21674 Transcript_13696/m.21674 type:complete len:213 (+) Transcript_13696:1219-1857(+)
MRTRIRVKVLVRQTLLGNRRLSTRYKHNTLLKLPTSLPKGTKLCFFSVGSDSIIAHISSGNQINSFFCELPSSIHNSSRWDMLQPNPRAPSRKTPSSQSLTKLFRVYVVNNPYHEESIFPCFFPHVILHFFFFEISLIVHFSFSFWFNLVNFGFYHRPSSLGIKRNLIFSRCFLFWVAETSSTYARLSNWLKSDFILTTCVQLTSHASSWLT